MQPIILFRDDLTTESELQIAGEHFDITRSRLNLSNKLVIGRYSVLPFYKELEEDLKSQGARLINSYEQHKYIANFEYYHDIKDLTPKTYFNPMEFSDYDGPFIVKGVTNSRKHQWNKMMFAQTKRQATEIMCDLRNDSLIGQQDIIFREYVPLKVLEEGINGLPFSNEWRFFCLGDTILTHGFYWTTADKKPSNSEIPLKAYDLVNEAIERVQGKVNFFVVDVAETATGDWIVIELNDGQMSGLNECPPEELYKNMQNYFIDYYHNRNL